MLNRFGEVLLCVFVLTYFPLFDSLAEFDSIKESSAGVLLATLSVAGWVCLAHRNCQSVVLCEVFTTHKVSWFMILVVCNVVMDALDSTSHANLARIYSTFGVVMGWVSLDAIRKKSRIFTLALAMFVLGLVSYQFWSFSIIGTEPARIFAWSLFGTHFSISKHEIRTLTLLYLLYISLSSLIRLMSRPSADVLAFLGADVSFSDLIDGVVADTSLYCDVVIVSVLC